MQHPGFYERVGPFRLDVVAQACGCEIGAKGAGAKQDGAAAPPLEISDVMSLDLAQAGHVAFLDNRKYLPALAETRASACFLAPEMAIRAPASLVLLLTKAPYHAFARALTLFYPGSGLPRTTEIAQGAAPVDPTAVLGADVVIEVGAVIGREARIGAGTRIASGAVIGYRCWIGDNSYVGPSASLTHAIIGNRAVLHAGVRIGQDGFGFAMGPGGHLKIPQIGRVIIEDDVEIGANTTIDRGALKDTIIGQGTKIDNLVQIGHNVVVGKHCVIVAQVAIAGSTVLGNYVVMGGQSGASGHIRLGDGAQIAGTSSVIDDVPAGERWAGTPARPLRQFVRESMALKALAARKKD